MGAFHTDVPASTAVPCRPKNTPLQREALPGPERPGPESECKRGAWLPSEATF